MKHVWAAQAWKKLLDSDRQARCCFWLSGVVEAVIWEYKSGLFVTFPQTDKPWNRCVFLKLILRLETRPVANRQFIHLGGWLTTSSGWISVGSCFVLLQFFLCLMNIKMLELGLQHPTTARFVPRPRVLVEIHKVPVRRYRLSPAFLLFDPEQGGRIFRADSTLRPISPLSHKPGFVCDGYSVDCTQRSSWRGVRRMAGWGDQIKEKSKALQPFFFFKS